MPNLLQDSACVTPVRCIYILSSSSDSCLLPWSVNASKCHGPNCQYIADSPEAQDNCCKKTLKRSRGSKIKLWLIPLTSKLASQVVPDERHASSAVQIPKSDVDDERHSGLSLHVYICTYCDVHIVMRALWMVLVALISWRWQYMCWQPWSSSISWLRTSRPSDWNGLAIRVIKGLWAWRQRRYGSLFNISILELVEYSMALKTLLPDLGLNLDCVISQASWREQVLQQHQHCSFLATAAKGICFVYCVNPDTI